MKKLRQFIASHKEQTALGLVGFFLLAGFIQVAFGLTYVIRLTPVFLAILTAITLVFWQVSIRLKLIALTIVTIASYVFELIGVHTGLLFGEYTYGTVLGFRLFDVPIFIGLTWFIVTLSAWHITGLNEQLSLVRRFLLGGVLVVMFDLILEQFATSYGLWSWRSGVVPLFNYISWFGISLLFFAVYNFLTPKTKSSLYVACMLPVMALFFWLMLLIA